MHQLKLCEVGASHATQFPFLSCPRHLWAHRASVVRAAGGNNAVFCSMAVQDFVTACKPVKVFPCLPSTALTTQICACPQTEWFPVVLCCWITAALSPIPTCFQFFLTFTLSFLVTATDLCDSLAISSASNCSNICSCHHIFFLILILSSFALHYLLSVSLDT